MEPIYFEINNSIQGKKPNIQQKEDVLILAPFQPVLKIEFTKVKLGSTSERYLLIQNPLNTLAKVEFLKLPQNDFHFSQKEFEISPKSQVSVKISWTPLRDGAFKHTFQIKSSRLKIDVGLICEAINLSKKTKNIKETTLKVKSKSRYSKFTSQNGSYIQKTTNIHQKQANLYKTTTLKRKSLSKTKQPLSELSSTKPLTPIDRRSTYSISRKGKENVFPQSPIKFTEDSNLNISDHFHSRINLSSDLINDKAQSPMSPYQTRSLNKTFSPEPNSLKSFENHMKSPNYSLVKNNLFKSSSPINQLSSENISKNYQSEAIDFSCIQEEREDNSSDQPLDLRKRKSPFNTRKPTPKYFCQTPNTPRRQHLSDFNTTKEFHDAVFGSIKEENEYEEREENELFLDDSFGLKISSPLNINVKTEKTSFSHYKSNQSVINNKTMKINYDAEMTIGTAMCLTPAINNQTMKLNFDPEMTLKSAMTMTPNESNKNHYTFLHPSTTQEMFHATPSRNDIMKLNNPTIKYSELPMTSTPAINDTKFKTKLHSEISPFYVNSTPAKNKFIKPLIKSEILTFSPPPNHLQIRKIRPSFVTPKKCSPHFKIRNSKKLKLIKNIPKTPNTQNTPRTAHKLKNKIYSDETSTEPFSSCGIYYDEDWLNDQQIHLTKWINALVQPNIDNSKDPSKIDIAAIWKQSCIKGLVTPAKSKEQVTEKWYNSPARFGSVHKAAARLFRDSSIKEPLVKIAQAIDKGILSIRADIKLCVDISVKAQVIEILLSYNPLWLRLGLEIVFNEPAPFRTNGDSIRSWLERLLIPSDKSKHPVTANIYLPNYQASSNKVFLKRWLSLVLLLDKAKKSRLFAHDPCLFERGSKVRSSRDVLCKIASLVLAGMGDIVKHMRSFGYVVTHEQRYVDEIYYGVTNIRQDLRDGIRLVRIVELVLGNYSLTSKLRAPAGSLLQKVHNVQVALDALSAAGFEIQGPPISARDIVNGHREKTLSLIWQIVYRLQGPRFEKSARIIQKWWRKIVLRLKKQKGNIFYNQECAALKIQYFWRKYIKKQNHKKQSQLIKIKAAIKIQRTWRRYNMFKNFKRIQYLRESAAIKIQRYWRSFKNRQHKQESAVILIQYFWRRFLKIKKKEELMSKSALIIQNAWKNYLLIKAKRLDQYNKESAVIKLQYFWRRFLKIKKKEELMYKSALIIQKAWKNYLLIKAKRLDQYNKECAVIKLQYFWRRFLKIKKKEELMYKSALIIQKAWKNYLLIKAKRLDQYNKESAVIKLQYFWRRYAQNKKTNNAARIIQRFWKKYFKIKQEKALLKETSAIRIQYAWRKYMKIKNKREWERANNAALIIQKSWRSYINFINKKKQNILLIKQKSAALIIVRYWKKYLIIKRKKSLAYKEESAAIKIQYFWRKYYKNKQFKIETAKLKSLNDLKRQSLLPQQIIPNKQESVRERFFKAVKKIENLNSSLGWQMNAMICIDTLTSLIPHICEHLSSRPHTLNIIKDIIKNSNRSLPEITISEYATNIFLTLSKHPPSCNSIFDQDDLIDLMIQVLNRSCKGKHKHLFLNSATILWLLALKNGSQIFTPTHKNILSRILALETQYDAIQKKHQPSNGKITYLLPNKKHEWHIGKAALPKRFEYPIHALQQILALL